MPAVFSIICNPVFRQASNNCSTDRSSFKARATATPPIIKADSASAVSRLDPFSLGNCLLISATKRRKT
ncbi:MAG: hypothetical protein HPY30_06280 [Gammaproteobacteria bacterium (ex Lamellibrachia satsuma)]|nr:MAG: hypothetical protein HPY30_06280 [Gammaproteobacteria bacterium (ex Lamellibrachia satsuma)]